MNLFSVKGQVRHRLFLGFEWNQPTVSRILDKQIWETTTTETIHGVYLTLMRELQ